MTPDEAASGTPLNVLVVSDEQTTLALVTDTLAGHSAQIVACTEPRQAPASALHDAIFVDCRLEGIDAPSMVRFLRRRWPASAVVCLFAQSESDAVALLRMGADNVSHGWSSRDFHAEVVRAAARRMSDVNAQLRITFGDLVYDREGRRLWCAGREVELTRREMQVFDCLFVHAETPVSVTTLQDFVWREEVSSGSNPVAVYVRYLRRKLMGSRLASVATLRGRGYQLTTRRRSSSL